MKRSSVSLLAALVAGLGLTSPALAQKAEVIHWWTSGGESAAVKQLADAYNKAGRPMGGQRDRRRRQRARRRAQSHRRRQSAGGLAVQYLQAVPRADR